MNYLYTILGFHGVTLSYMVRLNDNPYAKGDFLLFIKKTITCTLEKGNFYEAGWHAVNQALMLFKIGQPSKICIETHLRQMDGRKSTKSLRNQFSREVNSARNISNVE